MKSVCRQLFKKGLSVFLVAIMVLGLFAGYVARADDSYLAKEDKVKTYTRGYGARDFHEYDLIEGWHQKAECNLHFFYSDGYFTRETSLYNEHLATCSLNMAVASFANINENTTYETQSKDIVSILKDIGCETIYVNDGYKQKMTRDTIGACYGLKNIRLYKDNGELDDYVLIPIVIRGGGYEAEWASNVTLNTVGEAAGFSHGADIIMANVDTFINCYDLQSKVRDGHAIFWITGYSRAGAVSNISAKRLIDKYTAEYGNKVYAYTFEAPQGALDSTNWDMDKYSGIHNIINESDIVPYVAPSAMGFKRYGVDHYVPGSTTIEGSYKVTVSSAKYDNDKNIKITTKRDNDYLTVSEKNGLYVGARERMLKELKLVEPSFKFDDAFQLYEMILFTTDKSKQAKSFPIKNSGSVSLGDFEKGLIDQLCKWCSPSRSYYASHNISLDFTEFTSFQEGLATILELFMGLDGDSFNAITKKCTGLKDLIGFDFYLNRIRLFDIKAGVAILRTLNEFWDVLDTNAPDSPRISSYFSTEDTTRLKKAFITVGFFLMKFMSKDNRCDADEIFDGVSDESMVLLGTAAKVGSKLIQAHMPSVALAWVRTYDDFYRATEDYYDGQYKVTAIFYDDRGESVYANFFASPGETITFNTGEPYGLEFEGWEELQSADEHALDGLPEDFSYDMETKTATFTMPENSVHIRAIYKQMEFYDDIDLMITNDSFMNLQEQKGIDSDKLKVPSENEKNGEDELDITATAKDITYKDPINITFEGKDADVEKEIWYKIVGAADSEYTKEEPYEPGNYEVKVVISGVEGFKDKELKLSFSIEKRSVLIAVNEHQGKTYGEEDGIIGYTIENIADDGIDPEIVFEREAGEAVGEYEYHFVGCSDEFRKYYEIIIGIDSTYLIEPKDISDTDYEIDYNEKSKKATVRIKDTNNAIDSLNRTLVDGEDYDVLVLENYYEEDTVLVVVEGLDNYYNVIEKQYTVKQEHNNPDTGDYSNFLFWIILFIVAGAMLSGAVVIKKKNRR